MSVLFCFCCAAGRKGLDPPPPWLERFVFCFCFVVLGRVFVPTFARPPPGLNDVCLALCFNVVLCLSLCSCVFHCVLFHVLSVLFLLRNNWKRTTHSESQRNGAKRDGEKHSETKRNGGQCSETYRNVTKRKQWNEAERNGTNLSTTE